jgi:hypothetical protein
MAKNWKLASAVFILVAQAELGRPLCKLVSASCAPFRQAVRFRWFLS